METIIFGNAPPKIDLTADTQEGSIQYEVQNENFLSFEGQKGIITWRDLGRGAVPKILDRAVDQEDDEERDPHPLKPASQVNRARGS